MNDISFTGKTPLQIRGIWHSLETKILLGKVLTFVKLQFLNYYISCVARGLNYDNMINYMQPIKNWIIPQIWSSDKMIFTPNDFQMTMTLLRAISCGFFMQGSVIIIMNYWRISVENRNRSNYCPQTSW